jgi:Predicted acetyltransferase involved in intracellular survival and related acetyltransferases
MIIRPLRPDENGKSVSVCSVAFSFSADIAQAGKEQLNSEIIGAFLDDNETLTAMIYPNSYKSSYCGTFLPSVGIGGVASLPEHRRSGCIRSIFNEIFRLAPERGWATSYLYPFSYDYYRKFGYEKVLNNKTIKIPSSALGKIERNTDAVLYTGGVLIDDIVGIYNKFAAHHNIMFLRDATSHAYSAEPHKSRRFTYVWYSSLQPSSYATVTVEGNTMTVKELVYNDPTGLAGILGFLRMYEGQANEYYFAQLPEESELEFLLGEYVNCEYGLHSMAMGRVLLVEKLLNTNKYPEISGHFKLRVDDFLDYNRGVYEVEYSGGAAEVKKLSGAAFDTADYDVSMAIPALSRVMIGCGSYNAENAAYMPGVKLSNSAEDFFRAFPKRKGFLYDHF